MEQNNVLLMYRGVCLNWYTSLFFRGIMMLLAYLLNDNMADNCTLNVRDIYVLDTDDFIMQSISYFDLKDYIQSDLICVDNISYDSELDILYCPSASYDLLDITNYNSISSLDRNIIIVNSSNNEFSRNTVIINDVEIRPNFILNAESDIDKGYMFLINDIPVANFYPLLVDSNFFTIKSLINWSPLGFDLVYMLNKSIIAVKYTANDDNTRFSILLLFDIHGNFIDSYEYEDSAFIRLEDRKVSGLVAKLKTMNKGVV